MVYRVNTKLKFDEQGNIKLSYAQAARMILTGLTIYTLVYLLIQACS